jgi:hypothetical protein
MVGLLTGSGSDRGSIHPRTILATEIRHGPEISVGKALRPDLA